MLTQSQGVDASTRRRRLGAGGLDNDPGAQDSPEQEADELRGGGAH